METGYPILDIFIKLIFILLMLGILIVVVTRTAKILFSLIMIPVLLFFNLIILTIRGLKFILSGLFWSFEFLKSIFSAKEIIQKV